MHSPYPLLKPSRLQGATFSRPPFPPCPSGGCPPALPLLFPPSLGISSIIPAPGRPRCPSKAQRTSAPPRPCIQVTISFLPLPHAHSGTKGAHSAGAGARLCRPYRGAAPPAGRWAAGARLAARAAGAEERAARGRGLRSSGGGGGPSPRSPARPRLGRRSAARVPSRRRAAGRPGTRPPPPPPPPPLPLLPGARRSAHRPGCAPGPWPAPTRGRRPPAARSPDRGARPGRPARPRPPPAAMPAPRGPGGPRPC